MVTATLVLALVLDRLLGESRRLHPLVGFGWLTQQLEGLARRRSASAITGTVCWALLVIVPTLALCMLQSSAPAAVSAAISVLVLYYCIGGRSLTQHAQAIRLPLAAGDIAGARQQLAMIVSRDTAHLDEQGVASGTIESVLENGTDALLAPLFWFVLAGAPGALCYRLCNTLDAMWGYRSPEYENFGRTAAVADDLFNRPAAVFSALAYAFVGRFGPAIRCWREQGPLCSSPNGGPVMAAGAGALGVRVGGSAVYRGVTQERPSLGYGEAPAGSDIGRALTLLLRATVLWLLVIALLEWLL